MKKTITITIIALIVFACSHKTASTTQAVEKTSSATVTHEQWLKGKAIYDMNCNKCHAYKDPQNYSLDEWSKWMDKMAKKAKLTDDEKAQVIDFGSVNVKAN